MEYRTRSADWNYGGKKWKLSRSKIDLFFTCPQCFYLDNKLGVPRPKGFPFNLNSAVDALLKKEFDLYRAEKLSHPLMEEFKIDAIPFLHDKLDDWRENFKGVEFLDPETGFTVCGAVDDLWQNSNGEIHVVDYKSTSKDGEVSLDAPWQDGYKRQMEVYQWLLRKNGLSVSDTGYFVYCNGLLSRELFGGKLWFDMKIIPYTGDTAWVPEALLKIKETLEESAVPEASPECDYCGYRRAAERETEKISFHSKKSKTSQKISTSIPSHT
ncbi:MAG TPA: PD-(D/E)XK nuclease family protein [Candidatus Paceibacterota bacterium]|nr:PD-(D/E)XK nuclease family protein [Candidatus Paceibacterota bacterium]